MIEIYTNSVIGNLVYNNVVRPCFEDITDTCDKRQVVLPRQVHVLIGSNNSFNLTRVQIKLGLTPEEN